MYANTKQGNNFLFDIPSQEILVDLFETTKSHNVYTVPDNNNNFSVLLNFTTFGIVWE